MCDEESETVVVARIFLHKWEGEIYKSLEEIHISLSHL